MRSYRNAIALAGGLLVFAVVVIGFHNSQKFMDGLKTYSNVYITDTKADVLYRLGYPPIVMGDPVKLAGMTRYVNRVYYTKANADPNNSMPTGKHVEDFDEWAYPMGDQSHGNISTEVRFDHSTSNVIDISCVETVDTLSHPCKSLAGINVGDTEEIVLQRFGPPYRSTIDGVAKTIRYDDLGIEVVLTRGKVYTLTLLNERANAVTILKRYLQSLLP
jgi:hypothetical protein